MRMDLSERLLNTKALKHVLARSIICSMLLILPSCCIPQLRHGEEGPALPDSFNGATSSENSSQLWIEEFFNDSTLTSLIDEALAGNRELKILDEDGKDDADEPLPEIFEPKACEARACESARLQHAADAAVLCNPPSPPGGAGTRPAGELQRGDQPG